MIRDRVLPVAAPMLIGNEKAYVMDCLESTWISSSGKYIDRFEAAFADFCGAKSAVACCNGTVALHLALMALGVGPSDEIIVPTLTFVATANAVTYCGARPVFVDSEPDTWNMNPALLQEKITPRTKGIIVVHLYGHPVDMDPILSIARRQDLFVLEDAAEAHGAEYKGRRVGSLGDIATFSFYGNKILTTGEGGMVVTNDDTLSCKVRRLSAQGVDPLRRYWFPSIGYNYRMTNVTAAIGLAQLEKAPWHMQRRLEVAAWYKEQFRDVSAVVSQAEKEWARHAYWMFNVLLDDQLPLKRDDVITALAEKNIETRPVFYPMHRLPPYQGSGLEGYPVAESIAARGITLPTWAGLTNEDIRYISRCLLDFISRAREA